MVTVDLIPPPRELDLPLWVKGYRDHQVEAIVEIMKHIERGVKVVMLDAPTGSGKTLIGEVVRRMRQRVRGNHGQSAMYLCTTLTLQAQFADDFPTAKVIKGRANYPTLDSPDLFNRGAGSITAGDCTKGNGMRIPACDTCVEQPTSIKWQHRPDSMEAEGDFFMHCEWCHPQERCPYEMAKQDALRSELAVANTAYYLTEANGPGFFGRRDLVVIDEADNLENSLLSYVEFSLPTYWMKALGLQRPKVVSHSAKSAIDCWMDWSEQAINAMGDRSRSMGRSKDSKDVKRRKNLNGHLDRLKEIRAAKFDGWIYDYTAGDNNPNGSVTFKPIWVREVAQEKLWSTAEQFLLMSATIISPAQMADELGLERHEWAYVQVRSQFPVDRRPVFVRPVVNITAKTKAQELPKLAREVGKILHDHPNQRILVHTVSYDIATYLAKHLDPFRTMTYTDAKQRDAVLERFTSQQDAVVLAPSFDRGVDLPHDLCRVQVVAKVPYPSLMDKQVAARLHSTGAAGQSWYSIQTIRSIVQMTGRGMRSEDDWCVTYILDRQFPNNLYFRNKSLFPQWWRDALVFHAELFVPGWVEGEVRA